VTFLPSAPSPSQRRLRTAEAAAVFLGLRQTEAQFQRQVIRYAELMGWHCYFAQRSDKSPAGWPDLILIRRPRILFCELKAERGRVTADQQLCLDELRACGMAAHVWRPSDWKLVERTLA
jgi:hypothetical protein